MYAKIINLIIVFFEYFIVFVTDNLPPIQDNNVMENQMQIEKLIEKFYLGTLTNEELSSLLNYLKDQEPQHEVLVF